MLTNHEMSLLSLHKNGLHKIFIKLNFSLNFKAFLKIVILIFLFSNIYKVSYPQINNSYITGKITSKGNKETVKNANVYLAYTMLGSSTDKNGNYSIKNISPGRYTLVISHIAYETYNIKIAIKEGGKYNFDVALKPKIYLKDIPLFYVAAVSFIKDGKVYTSLITVPPNEFMEDIHNRMPVILDIKTAASFLNDNVEGNFNICVPYSEDKYMELHPVNLLKYNGQKKILKLKRKE